MRCYITNGVILLGDRKCINRGKCTLLHLTHALYKYPAN